MSFKENRVRLSVLVQSVLCLGLIVLVYALFFRDNSAFSLGENSVSRANSTRTAIAGTMDALMGPFPTATQPTKTPSLTPTVTPIFTPTPTASATPTPTMYTRLLSPTPRDRDRAGVQSQFGGWPTPTPIPANPPVPSTVITDPPPAATEEPVATEEPTEEATEPPAEETEEPSAPTAEPIIELPELPLVP